MPMDPQLIMRIPNGRQLTREEFYAAREGASERCPELLGHLDAMRLALARIAELAHHNPGERTLTRIVRIARDALEM